MSLEEVDGRKAVLAGALRRSLNRR